MSITLYHNPKCSKSRQTLELLQQNGITPTIIEYLKTPPTAEALKGFSKGIKSLLDYIKIPYKTA